MKTALLYSIMVWLMCCLGCKTEPQNLLLGKWVFHHLTINEASNPHPDEYKSLKDFEEMVRQNGIIFEFAPKDSVFLSSKLRLSPGTFTFSPQEHKAKVNVKDNVPDVFDIENITDTSFTVTLPQDLPYHILHFKKVE